MNHAEVLPAVLDRLAAADGEVALFSERELAEWPAAALARLKTEGLLVKGPPADTLTCPGCEEDCTMPVEIVTTAGGAMRAFVVCDKRDDVARVAVGRDLLEQWTCSPERVADVLARLLCIRRNNGDTAALRWDVGVLRGVKGSAHVVLGIERELRLTIAGHSLPVVDVLELGDKELNIDRRALLRCVDNPVAPAGDRESAEQRRERLRTRRNELRASGVRNFNQVLAQEEGISVSAIKQLLHEKKPADTWLGVNLNPKQPVQGKSKARR
ncbi:MAG: hypothetical protein JNK92_05085 [Dechloromonas sp.]|nr:hypothetical protein [Dechloromonas sp.]